MHLILKDTAKTLRLRLLIALLATLFGAASSLMAQLGFLLFPITATLLTLLLFLERGRAKVTSAVAIVLVLTLDLIFNGIYSVVALCTVFASVLAYIFISKSLLSKGDSAIAITALISLFFGLAMLMYAFYEVGSFDFSKAENYYTGVMEQMKESFIGGVMRAVNSIDDPEMSRLLGESYLSAIMDSYFLSFMSVLALIAFTLTGLYFKLLWFALGRCIKSSVFFSRRRFFLTPAYAYAYIAAYFMSGIVGTTDALTVVIMNFTNVFMYIFAYLGFVFLLALFERRIGNKFISVAIIIFAALMFYSFAATVLSFVGVFSMLSLDRERRRHEYDANKK